MTSTTLDKALLRANIVLTGSWNPAILTPPWMSEHGIIEDVQADVQLSVQPPSVTYTSGGFRWNARTDRLMVESQVATDWARCAEFVASVLAKLPHTPLAALGVNFIFDQRGGGALDLPGDASAAVCAHLRGEILEEAHIVRVRGEGWVLNLKSVARAAQPVLDFNFHHDVSSGEYVKAALGRAPSLYCRAGEIVEMVSQRRQP